jgi:hypothetical protein
MQIYFCFSALLKEFVKRWKTRGEVKRKINIISCKFSSLDDCGLCNIFEGEIGKRSNFLRLCDGRKEWRLFCLLIEKERKSERGKWGKSNWLKKQNNLNLLDTSLL